MLLGCSRCEAGHVDFKLAADCAAGLFCFRSLLDILRKLLGAKRDQHAEDDDADFAGELAPAMQRFRQFYIDRAGSPRLRERNRHACIRNGSKADVD